EGVAPAPPSPLPGPESEKVRRQQAVDSRDAEVPEPQPRGGESSSRVAGRRSLHQKNARENAEGEDRRVLRADRPGAGPPGSPGAISDLPAPHQGEGTQRPDCCCPCAARGVAEAGSDPSP